MADDENRADKQHPDDPRGGVQSTAMSGPGGAPQEGESVEERRARDRD